MLGFNGERPDPVTGHYLLGQGHRAYNPMLMRFNSPDTLSPFGKGGTNAYAYCANNPITRIDPTGESWVTKILSKQYKAYKILQEAGQPTTDKYVNDYLLNNAFEKLDNSRAIAKTTKYIKQIKSHIDLAKHQTNQIMRHISELPLVAHTRGHDLYDHANKLKTVVLEKKEYIGHLKTLQKNTEDYLDELLKKPKPTDTTTTLFNIRTK